MRQLTVAIMSHFAPRPSARTARRHRRRAAPSRSARARFADLSERACAKARFFPHFVRFQGFARRKISVSVVTPRPSSARPAFGDGRKQRRFRSSRDPTLSRFATCGRARAAAQGSSTRSERCRRRSCAGSATRERNRVDPKTIARVRFFRKNFFGFTHEGTKCGIMRSVSPRPELNCIRAALARLNA